MSGLQRIIFHTVIELRLVDPDRNRFRFYRMHQQANLFHGIDLVIERGRLGSRPTLRIEPFACLDSLTKRWRALIARRKRNGYLELLPSTASTPHAQRSPVTPPPIAHPDQLELELRLRC